MNRIYYTKPSITQREISYATDAAANGWGDQCYQYISRFEEAFRLHLGVSHAIATASCTGALHMGLAALGIGPGDEVILADTNWIATAACITYLGAKPVFVDILPDTWCIDPQKAEEAISPRTKAILAVHIYGNLCNMDELLALGEKHGIFIIEDAAEAIGSVYHGRRAGSLGKFGVFSFHGTKTMTTGEGGMFVTDDDLLYEKLLTLSNHGRESDRIRQFEPVMIGFKYKMSNIEAAIGCAQLERIDELILRKREILNFYKTHLEGIPGVSMNPEHDGTINGAWMPTIVFDQATGMTREKLQRAFADQDIDARVFFRPLSSLPMFTGVPSNRLAWDIPTRASNLPSYHDMSAEELRFVSTVVTRTLEEKC